MWDNHTLLGAIAHALYLFSLGVILYGVSYYIVHRSDLFPMAHVRLSAPPENVGGDEVLQVIRREVRGNFFTVDIENLKRALEQVSWVRKVNIRREFPDSLVLELEEHHALAHWNHNSLVSQLGEVFSANSEQSLPDFVAPNEMSHEVALEYALMNQQVAALNLHVTQLAVSSRHAWQLNLSNEMVLELGREDVQHRLTRFIALYPYSLAAMQAESSTRMINVDLRYPNGFAVKGLIKG
jgi:cell division protein FtsQ